MLLAFFDMPERRSCVTDDYSDGWQTCRGCDREFNSLDDERRNHWECPHCEHDNSPCGTGSSQEAVEFKRILKKHKKSKGKSD